MSQHKLSWPHISKGRWSGAAGLLGMGPWAGVLWRPRWHPALRGRLWAGLELLVVLGWGLVFTHPYLNFDPMAIPLGREFGQDIMPHHFWTRLMECGVCALWFGGARGGTPALIEPVNSSVLHPLVA